MFNQSIIFLTALYIWFGYGFGVGSGNGLYNREKIPYICTLPPVTGPCLALFQRWAYNPYSHRCEQFTYGGCDGNYNNFESLEECNKCCPTYGRGCVAVNITVCQSPIDVNDGQCGGGQFDRFKSEDTGCETLCPLICRQPFPQSCPLACVWNICQCEEGYYRRVSDCQCVPKSDCPFNG